MTFKFHGSVSQSVPWQAMYTFPSQQTKVNKHLVKLPPKNGSVFQENQLMRIEFPSDNYLNVLNSVLQFDLNTDSVTTNLTTTSAVTAVNAATISSSGNLTVAANAYDGGVVQVMNTKGFYDSYTIASHTAPAGAAALVITTTTPVRNAIAATAAMNVIPNVKLQQGGAHNVISRIRILYGSLVLEDIQQYKTIARMLYEVGASKGYLGSSGSIVDGTAAGRWVDQKSALQSGSYLPGDAQDIIQCSSTKTYALNLFTGLLTCKKLIPLKWMAAQLAIEITLAQSTEAYLSPVQQPSLRLTNVNYIAEMLEFDSTYDSSFFQGLISGGVPLKFNSWHYHSFSMSGGNQIYQIHERARSVKFVMAVAKDATQPSYKIDSDIFYHDMAQYMNTAGVMITDASPSLINSVQTRVGGRYYPSQPIRTIQGGGELYSEVQKILDTGGDYRSDCNIDLLEWQAQGSLTQPQNFGVVGGSGTKFIMGISFENDISNDEISGINAEEQSDIALMITSGGTGPVALGPKILMAFVAYDSMMIVRDGNVVDLVL